eukprot:CAMPEP_0183791476 /NCGR_PEP_ID=MMETSP0803_2-20130417/1883_1 /TAXON_ID=195967 /ORGANISM="Crustomastix stigmata, Strain CCMP3273" /LENGTH=461 /DNA_ID=CAMNT_0026035791 /DNA_START=33 /DNA_END=1415 /DNA_ORIENTATION=+
MATESSAHEGVLKQWLARNFVLIIVSIQGDDKLCARFKTFGITIVHLYFCGESTERNSINVSALDCTEDQLWKISSVPEVKQMVEARSKNVCNVFVYADPNLHDVEGCFPEVPRLRHWDDFRRKEWSLVEDKIMLTQSGFWNKLGLTHDCIILSFDEAKEVIVEKVLSKYDLDRPLILSFDMSQYIMSGASGVRVIHDLITLRSALSEFQTKSKMFICTLFREGIAVELVGCVWNDHTIAFPPEENVTMWSPQSNSLCYFGNHNIWRPPPHISSLLHELTVNIGELLRKEFSFKGFFNANVILDFLQGRNAGIFPLEVNARAPNNRRLDWKWFGFIDSAMKSGAQFQSSVFDRALQNLAAERHVSLPGPIPILCKTDGFQQGFSDTTFHFLCEFDCPSEGEVRVTPVRGVAHDIQIIFISPKFAGSISLSSKLMESGLLLAPLVQKCFEHLACNNLIHSRW